MRNLKLLLSLGVSLLVLSLSTEAWARAAGPKPQPNQIHCSARLNDSSTGQDVVLSTSNRLEQVELGLGLGIRFEMQFDDQSAAGDATATSLLIQVYDHGKPVSAPMTMSATTRHFAMTAKGVEASCFRIK